MNKSQKESTSFFNAEDAEVHAEGAKEFSLGSTGHWPVPSGDSPLGREKAHEFFNASVSIFDVSPVPSGQWPDGTGGSPVPPIPIALIQFIFNG